MYLVEGTYGRHDHSEVVRIWVITPLTVHLLSHHGEGLQSQTPPCVLCFHLQLPLPGMLSA